MQILNLSGKTILEGTGTIKEIIEKAVLLQRGNNEYRGIDLRNANLAGLDLSYIQGTEIDFRGADLTNTNFYGSDLRRCDFRGAILTQTDFTDADLKYCNFDNEDLTTSKTKGTNFNEANLTNIKKELNQEIIT